MRLYDLESVPSAGVEEIDEEEEFLTTILTWTMMASQNTNRLSPTLKDY